MAQISVLGGVAYCAAPLLALFLVASLPATAAEETIRLKPGTALDVYAVGLPDFRFRVVVNDEGEASFPLLEPMRVERMSLAELRSLLKVQLPTKVYRQRNGDGLDNLISILPEEIVVEVAEYPPVYVTGDVTTAGRVAFRPGMTAREAIALAGGFDPTRSRSVDPALESANIQGELASAWIEHAGLQAQQLGIEASLAGQPVGEEIARRIDVPLRPATIRAIAADEVTRLKELDDDYQEDRAHVRKLIGEDERELAEMEAEQTIVLTRLKEQEAFASQKRDELQAGVITASRYGEERRDAFYMRAHALGLSARISALKRDKSELERRLEASAAKRRIDWLANLQDNRLRQEALKAQIASLEDKAAYVGNAGIGLSTAGGLRALITIHRRNLGTMQTRRIDEDATLLSGDVVEVTLERPASSWNASRSLGGFREAEPSIN